MPTLSISSEKVCYLIVKAREFDVQDVIAEPDDAHDDGSNGSDDRMIAVLEQRSDNAVVEEIRSFVDDLSEEEQADLVALSQLGRGDGTLGDWEAMHNQAMREQDGRTAAYLLGQPLVSDYLEEGLSQFGFSCAEFEEGRR